MDGDLDLIQIEPMPKPAPEIAPPSREEIAGARAKGRADYRAHRGAGAYPGGEALAIRDAWTEGFLGASDEAKGIARRRRGPA